MNSPVTGSTTIVSPESELKRGLASIYQAQELTDFTIRCGPHTFNVHRTIISAHSEYFRAACTRDFKESHTNTINLITAEDDPICGDDPEAIKQMIHYFYHLDYEAPPIEGYKASSRPTSSKTQTSFHGKALSKKQLKRALGGTLSESHSLTPPPKKARTSYSPAKQPAQSSLLDPSITSSPDGNHLLHARIFAAAVKYQVHGLRKLAAASFLAALQSNAHHSDLPQAVRAAYTTTVDSVRELRDGVVEVLDLKPELQDLAGMEGVMREISGLAWEVLRKARAT